MTAIFSHLTSKVAAFPTVEMSLKILVSLCQHDNGMVHMIKYVCNMECVVYIPECVHVPECMCVCVCLSVHVYVPCVHVPECMCVCVCLCVCFVHTNTPCAAL